MCANQKHPSGRSITIALIALLVILAPTAALATEWWVNPVNGSDSNPGTSVGAALRTISAAASRAQSNDVIHLLPGAHSGTISGPSNTIWEGDQANPAAAYNVGLSLSSTNVTVRWVRARSLSVSGQLNKLWGVTMKDTTQSVYWNGDNNTGDDLTIHCFRFHMVGADANFYPVSNWVEGNSILNSTIYCHSTSGASNVVYLRSGRGNLFRNVRWFVRASGSFYDAQLYNQYNWVSSRFIDCFWDIANLKSTDDNVKIAFNVRDQVANPPSYNGGFTAMEACTIWVRPGNGRRADILFSNSGTHPGSVGRNRYERLLVLHQGQTSNYGAAVYWQNQARNDTVRNSVFVSERFTPFQIDFDKDSVLIEHNTFIGVGTREAAELATDPFYSGGGPHFLRRNIFYSRIANTSSAAPLTWNSSRDDERSRESLIYAEAGNSGYAVANTAGSPSTAGSYDAASRWGNPRFAGPMDMASILTWVFTLRQNPFQLLDGSDGLNRSGYTPWTNGYVGAFGDPGGAPGPDITPPAAVNDLGGQTSAP